MNKKFKNRDVVRIINGGYSSHPKRWYWERYRRGMIVSFYSGGYSVKKRCIEMAKEINPGCKVEIEGEK